MMEDREDIIPLTIILVLMMLMEREDRGRRGWEKIESIREAWFPSALR